MRTLQITDVKPTPAKVEPPSRWNSMRVPGDQRGLRLPGLLPDSCYDLRIEARGSAGHGQPASLVFCTTSGALFLDFPIGPVYIFGSLIADLSADMFDLNVRGTLFFHSSLPFRV